MTGKPLPDVSDPEFAPYFDACREHRLVVQECVRCGKRRWPPRPACAACHSLESKWVQVPGEGLLYSWVNIWRPGVPGFEGETPYVAAIVEVDAESPIRFLGNVLGARSEDLAIGMTMQAVFQDVAAGITLPYWRVRQ
jgi:uncharacterized OB-fold protein